MYSLNTLILVVIVTALAAGSVVWLVMIVGQLRARVIELERAQRQPQAPPPHTPAWAENLKLDHRAQLLSIAELVKLSARDNLDALHRMSPEMVLEIVRDIAPQLFNKENVK